MSNFHVVRSAVKAQVAKMIALGNPILQTVECKEELWDTYLSSFPEGLNPTFRERTEHDCNCCKAFIRQIGNVVTYDNKGNLISIWDVEAGEYQPVVDALSALVKSKAVDTTFVHWEGHVGVEFNFDTETAQRWEHFYTKLPRELHMKNSDIASKIGEDRNNYQVLKRSVSEISHEAVKTVLDLINSNNLYRGTEFKRVVDTLNKLHNKFDKLSDGAKELEYWKLSLQMKGASAIRNTVIGTLLVDLSNGDDINLAVAKFESKTAPANYKRPTAIITPAMVEKAQAAIEELGYSASLARRPAVTEDLTINNVLFADSAAANVMGGGILDILKSEVTHKQPSSKEAINISIEDFIKTVLPTTTSLEAMMANNHIGNLVSLVSPVDAEAPSMFQWDNNFSWSYNGGVTDSIAQRVKEAGGNIVADVRVSLAWFNHDDLDLSIREPNGHVVYFGNRRSASSNGGQLDVDMQAGGGTTRTPVENITYKNASKMQTGVYEAIVHNYRRRESTDVGYEIEFEALGMVFNASSDKSPTNNGRVTALKFEVLPNRQIKLLTDLSASKNSKKEWDINTNQWTKVSMMMLSPNHWDDNSAGNKHYFFMLDGCKNPESIRGFYNEFLNSDLKDHRKVFEVLGAKMAAESTDNQLSGLGFSSTLRNELLVKATGTSTRTYLVKF